MDKPCHFKVGHTGGAGFDTGIFVTNPTPFHASGTVFIRYNSGSGGVPINVEDLEPFGIRPYMLSEIATNPWFNNHGAVANISVSGDIEATVVWLNKESGKWFNGSVVTEKTSLINQEDRDTWTPCGPGSSWYWERFQGDTAHYGQATTIQAWKLFCKWFTINELKNYSHEPGSPRCFLADMGGVAKFVDPEGHPAGSHATGEDFDVLYFTTHPTSNYTQMYGGGYDREIKKVEYPYVKIYTNGTVIDESNFQVGRNIRWLFAVRKYFPGSTIFIRDFTYRGLESLCPKYGINPREFHQILFHHTSKDSEDSWNHHIHYHVRLNKMRGVKWFLEDEIRADLKALNCPVTKY